MQFWELKRIATAAIYDVLKDGEKSTAELDAGQKLKRDEYFRAARAAWTNVQDIFVQLHKEIIGPYVLGKIVPYIQSQLCYIANSELEL